MTDGDHSGPDVQFRIDGGDETGKSFIGSLKQEIEKRTVFEEVMPERIGDGKNDMTVIDAKHMLSHGRGTLLVV